MSFLTSSYAGTGETELRLMSRSTNTMVGRSMKRYGSRSRCEARALWYEYNDGALRLEGSTMVAGVGDHVAKLRNYE